MPRVNVNTLNAKGVIRSLYSGKQIGWRKKRKRVLKLVTTFGIANLHILLVLLYLKNAMKLKLENLMYMWLWWSINVHFKAKSDSLKPGDRLIDSKLYSQNRRYYLAFNQTSVGNDYLVVWNENMDEIVWIGNVNQPVDPKSAVLSLNQSGVLKIESQRGKPIILYSPPQPINNTVATLLDTGNFALQQFHSNGTNTTLWQSFDYPYDILLPTMKLGVNHKTGHNWFLVSYFTVSVISPGSFSLEWEPIGQELVIRRSGQVSWRSGKLRNNRFEQIPEDAQQMLNYTVVSNGDENSFSFTTTNDEDVGLLISNTGNIKNYNITIVRADMCYGYNNHGGCQTWQEIPKCRNPGDLFEGINGHFNYDLWSETNTNYRTSDCQDICWSNCSCTGFKELFPNGTGCTFFSEGVYTPGSDGEQFYILKNQVPNIDNHSSKSQSPGTIKWIWISAVIACSLLTICLSVVCFSLKKLKYALQEKKGKEMMMEIPTSKCNESLTIEGFEDDIEKGHLKVFTYTSIMMATNGFSSENKLGQGGFGPVYKGILLTGQEIAVKRLSKTSAQGNVEFKNEVTLICELQHMNLVQLLGCCIHEEEKILIYEYMPNKSLDFHLFDSTRSKLLDWKTRFNIVEGISQGLLYLHKYSRLKVIHRDLKASNILLDENMNPKISDFGMARMFTQQESVSNTSRIVGTYGYMSPEYAMEGAFSTKSDVFSFGVLLLEIVSGRRNTSFYDVDHPLNLIGHAWELWKGGVCLELADPSLNESFDPDEVQRCIHVGLLCVEHYANDRPTMSEIVSMLTNKSTIASLPRGPAFYVQRNIFDGKLSSRELYSTTDEITASMETYSK
ncbi:hypothetical protein VNO78_06671 [Psophocarpus tetragonolobus]|uniref:Receptor-like serine/threonine-protein kinase n=1 Tax=Psophocarpus tetragonolobus TaxID=3891 RepID=A0AAN9T2D2_PSOTE